MRSLLLVVTILFGLSIQYVHGQVEEDIPTLGIVPLNHEGDLEESWIRFINSSLITEMSDFGSDTYYFVERNRIEQIINEYDLQLSGVISESSSTRIGELLGAEYILIGDVIYISSENTVSISTRIVNVSTGQIIQTSQKESELYPPQLKYVINLLSLELLEKERIEKSIEQIVDVSSSFTKLPAPPEAELGINLPIEEYEDLQKKVSDALENSKWDDADIYLAELSNLAENDSNNSFFSNNPADSHYLREIGNWIEAVEIQLTEIYVSAGSSQIIEEIAKVKTQYYRLMRNHISPAESQAIEIRHFTILKGIDDLKYSEEILNDPLVQQAYVNVFRLRILDDYDEYHSHLVSEEKIINQRLDSIQTKYRNSWHANVSVGGGFYGISKLNDVHSAFYEGDSLFPLIPKIEASLFYLGKSNFIQGISFSFAMLTKSNGDSYNDEISLSSWSVTYEIGYVPFLKEVFLFYPSIGLGIVSCDTDVGGIHQPAYSGYGTSSYSYTSSLSFLLDFGITTMFFPFLNVNRNRSDEFGIGLKVGFSLPILTFDQYMYPATVVEDNYSNGLPELKGGNFYLLLRFSWMSS